MSAYPPTSTNTQYSPAQNVYVRQTSSGNSDRMSMSPKRIELKFTDSFRERLNFRSRHDSNHLSSVDIDMLEEDLGFPPACDDPPPDFISFGSSLTSDSASNSVDFRVRSRSDAASHSNQPMGTIFFFPNSNKLGDNSVQKNVHVQRANLHGSCSNGLDNIYEDKRLAASVPKIMQPCNLFVDTKLANENIVQRRRRMNHVNLPPLYDAHSFPTCPPMGISRSARCSHSPTNQEFNQFSCVWKGKDKLRPRASSFRQHPRRAILPTHLQRSCDSGLESSFSNFALVVKENMRFNTSLDATSPAFSPCVSSFQSDIFKVVYESQNAVYALFMKAHKCYDLIPTSSKLVVFDTDLPVKKAIFALAYNGVRAAPLWDSKKQKYIGMLTITDFIRVLCKYYQSDSKSEYIMGLEKQKIEEWRKVLNEDHQLRPLVGVDPSENLYQAVKILCETKVHRLPILGNSTGNISYIFTHKRIIKFLHLYIVDLPRPSFMDESPRKLGIGTWENICTINRNTTVIEALKAFLKERVSAIPLVDEEGRIIDIYSKFDVVDLVADQSWNNLDISVFDVLKYRSEFFEGVKKCSEMDSLLTVVDILSRTDVHRIIVVDDMDRVIGVISLSDILRFLIINPPTMEENAVSDVLNDSGSQSAGNIDNAILPNEAGLI